MKQILSSIRHLNFLEVSLSRLIEYIYFVPQRNRTNGVNTLQRTKRDHHNSQESGDRPAVRQLHSHCP